METPEAGNSVMTHRVLQRRIAIKIPMHKWHCLLLHFRHILLHYFRRSHLNFRRPLLCCFRHSLLYSRRSLLCHFLHSFDIVLISCVMQQEDLTENLPVQLSTLNSHFVVDSHTSKCPGKSFHMAKKDIRGHLGGKRIQLCFIIFNLLFLMNVVSSWKVKVNFTHVKTIVGLLCDREMTRPSGSPQTCWSCFGLPHGE